MAKSILTLLLTLLLCSCKTINEIQKETIHDHYHTDSVKCDTKVIRQDSVYIIQNDSLITIKEYHTLYKDSIRLQILRDTVYVKQQIEVEKEKESIFDLSKMIFFSLLTLFGTIIVVTCYRAVKSIS